MNLNINEPKVVVANNLDLRWKEKTIYNHYDNPTDFMDDILNNYNDCFLYFTYCNCN